MPSYDSTADVKKLLDYARGRVPFAKGGKVDKKPKPKRIILWKGKVKDWPGAQKAKERTGKEHGGKIPIRKDPGEKGKGFTPKWTSRPGKRRKTAKKQRTSGRDRKINPQWLKEKYNVDVKQREPRRKTLAVTDKYKKIRDSLGLKKGGKVRRKKEMREKTKTKYRGSNIEKPEWGFKKGGKADNKWIQKATKGMRKDKPCTGKKFGSATCPPGSKRYNLAKTFKKMARSKHASGGLVRYI